MISNADSPRFLQVSTTNRTRERNYSPRRGAGIEADFPNDDTNLNTPLSFIIGQRYTFMMKENPESLFVLQDISTPSSIPRC